MAMPTQQSGKELFSGIDSAGLPWRILLFSGIVFGLSLFVYFGFRFGYESYLNSRSEKLDQKIEALASEISQEDQQNFIAFYSQLSNLKQVMGTHAFSGNVFSFLEANTLPQVFYTEAQYDGTSSGVSLSGTANSLTMLAAQLAQFNKAPQVMNASLNTMGFDPKTNVVSFSMDLTFQPDFFTKPQ